jgi:hypothetical protein
MKKRIHKNIEKIVNAYVENPGLFKPGTVNDIFISHDDWCDIFKNKPCNCQPDITLEIKPLPGDPGAGEMGQK